MFMDQKTQYLKMTMVFKLIYRFDIVAIKIQLAFFADIE